MILFEQRRLPVFQNKVYEDRESARRAPLGDVELVQVGPLVHNRCFVPEHLEYNETYQNEQAHAPVFRSHLQEVLQWLSPHLKGEVLEIGCGKGVFLQELQDAGYTVRGLDPAYQGSNPGIERRNFDAEYDGHDFRFVVLRHVLEHVANPWEFLESIAEKAHPDCRIYIEVPCFDWSARHGAFFDIFYEHVNYFVESVLCAAFDDVVDVAHFFGGQYLSVVARLSTVRTPRIGQSPPSMDLLYSWREGLIAGLDERPLFVWGAGAKGTTFVNIAWRTNKIVDALIDINPSKQGRFAGLSAVPIVAPSQVPPGCNVVVMNSMYEGLAREMLPQNCNFILAEAR